MRTVIRYGILATASLVGANLFALPAGPPAILRADGIGPAAAIVRFGTPKPVAMRRLSTVLGSPVGQRTIADCGQGEPMSEVTFRGHLVLTFFHNRFSGWTLADGTSYVTDKGLGIGSGRAAILKAYPGTAVADGPFGVGFDSENGVSGFLNSKRPRGQVIGLYAGETCMVS